MILLNGNSITPTIFPDNTSQVWKLPDYYFFTSHSQHQIEWHFENEGEFLQLVQLKSLLSSRGIDSNRISLFLPYLPYGRQDKPVTNETTFALYSFSILLNTLNFSKVLIIDPHSEIALQCIKNAEAIYPTEITRKTAKETKTDLFCYPDKGAVDKYSKIYDVPYIFGEKLRDPLTGYISKYEVIGDPKDKNILIVDDICDGGMTFILLAKDLLKMGAKEVNLFVTHGIFSKGLEGLLDSGIKRIFTQYGEQYLNW